MLQASMARRKSDKISFLKTRIWAHACAKEASKNSTPATPYSLSIISSDYLDQARTRLSDQEQLRFPKAIDNARWSRWLRGLRTVTPRTVMALDGIWPGTADVYTIGPTAGPWIKQVTHLPEPGHREIFDEQLNNKAPVPLWASLSTHKQDILAGWETIPKRIWASWTPDKLELNSEWKKLSEEYYKVDLPENYAREKFDKWMAKHNEDYDFTDNSPSIHEYYHGTPPTRPTQIGSRINNWNWWVPNPSHFINYNALCSFLWDYIERAGRTHPLIVLTAMLSVGSNEYMGLPTITKEWLENSLTTYGVSIVEIFDCMPQRRSD